MADGLIFEPTCAICTMGPYASLSVCLSVCVYSGYIMHHYNGIRGTCAPSGRNMHHGAQGRLYFFLKFRGP